MRSARRSPRCCAQDYSGECASSWSTTTAGTRPPRLRARPPRALGKAERLTVLSGRALPAGWTGKLWAQQQGVAFRRRVAAAAGLCAADRCRYRLCAGRRLAAGRARARKRRGAHLADGETALYEPRRAGLHPGLHLLFSDALSVRLGERSASRDCGGGRRLHAGAPRCAARRGRHGGDPRRADRRLRARQAAQGARPDLDRADRARAQHPRLSGRGGHPPHGCAHRLCATALFAVCCSPARFSAWR